MQHFKDNLSTKVTRCDLSYKYNKEWSTEMLAPGPKNITSSDPSLNA